MQTRHGGRRGGRRAVGFAGASGARARRFRRPSLPPSAAVPAAWRARSPSLPLRSAALLCTELPGTLPVPMPTSGAGAGSLRSEAARSGRPEACAMWAGASAPRGAECLDSRVRAGARAQDLGRQPRRGTARRLRHAPRRGASPKLPRALSPPSRITPCLSRPGSSSRSPATRTACAGRLRVVGGG